MSLRVVHKTVFVSFGVEFDNYPEAAAHEDRWKAHLAYIRSNRPDTTCYEGEPPSVDDTQ